MGPEEEVVYYHPERDYLYILKDGEMHLEDSEGMADKVTIYVRPPGAPMTSAYPVTRLSVKEWEGSFGFVRIGEL